jgi:hypothetical protein
MLLEYLLGLPIGTRVFGDIGVAMNVAGVINSLEDGSHVIRWEDGYVTVPLGRVRDADEYIAAHTRLSSPCSYLPVSDFNGAESYQQEDMSRVS